MELAFLNNMGIHPIINPINANLVCIGKLLKRYFRILPNNNIPVTPPRPIGSKNLKFVLKSLKIFKTLFINFSYKPKITQRTPLLIPGSIAPAPIAIPFK